MACLLRIESLDDPPEERRFDSVSDAIEFASAWFTSGYNELIKGDPTLAADVQRDAAELRRTLTIGQEFYCGRFYEKAAIVPVN
jgi:hypothetical protein